MRDWKRLQGSSFYYFSLHLLIGFIIFSIWTAYDNTFSKRDWELFSSIFVISFFNVFISRSIAYGFLYSICFLLKRSLPGFIEINRKTRLNKISFTFIIALLILSIIYTWGINQIIYGIFRDDYGSFAFVITYVIVKVGALCTSWIFTKI